MRGVIITAYVSGKISHLIEDGDYIICADKGFKIAEKNGIVPQVTIGDMDSANGERPKDCLFLKFPIEKDDTDTGLCLKHAIEKGIKNVLIIGGVGGRADHTYANIQTLAYAAQRGVRAKIVSENTVMMMLLPGTERIKKQENSFISVFSYSPESTGVTIRGTKYETENATLTYGFPLGVSNEFRADYAQISHTSGMLLVIVAKENKN